MSLFGKVLDRVAGIPQQQSYMQPYREQYTFKSRFSLIGTVGAGKSAVVSGIVLTAHTLSATQPGFIVEILENDTNILTDVSRLRQGRFPAKTNPFQPAAPEAGLLLTLPKFPRGQKHIQVPIADCAGEDIQGMIRRVQRNRQMSREDYNANVNIINYIRDSDGFILVVPASRALIAQGNALEREMAGLDDSCPEVQSDPDVPLNQILGSIINYKRQTHAKPIKAIGVVITKWDLIQPYAVNLDMDLYDPSGRGLNRFMDICFPGTRSMLKAVGMDKVRFFPSFFQAQRNEEGTINCWSDGGTKIQVISERRVPVYAETSYMELFNWLGTFAQ